MGVLVPLQSRGAGHTLANVTEFFDFIIGELKIKDREIFLHMFLARIAIRKRDCIGEVILTFEKLPKKN